MWHQNVGSGADSAPGRTSSRRQAHKPANVPYAARMLRVLSVPVGTQWTPTPAETTGMSGIGRGRCNS